MRFLVYRSCIGLLGLSVFWKLGFLSGGEFAQAGVLMGACLMGLVGCLTIYRPRTTWLTCLPAAVFFLFFFDAAVKGFLRTYFGLRPNHSMVLQAVFTSHTQEAKEFLFHNWQTLGTVAAVFALVALFAIAAERYLSARERSFPASPKSALTKVFVLVMLVFFIALHFNPVMRKENPVLFWPLRYMAYQNSLRDVISIQEEFKRHALKRSEWHVKYVGDLTRTVVLIIGESTNRANMSLYGYPRRTTPMLDAMRPELIVFKDVLSPDASTMPSLMKMLTPAHLGQPDAWRWTPDIVTLAKEAGYKTFWLSNQARNDGWVGLVAAQADSRVFINHGAGPYENNYDANLLPHFGSALDDPAPRKLIVVHMLGAHPAYDMRYTGEFARFNSMTDEVAKSLDQQGRSFRIKQHRNEYDNAILYNDHVISGVIGTLARHPSSTPSALIYASDHGQEVGHYRNHAGHSPIDKSGYEIPMIVWDRTMFAMGATAKINLENRPYQTDHLDHTLLGLLKIESIYYDATRDILSQGFTPMKRSINGVPYGLGE